MPMPFMNMNEIDMPLMMNEIDANAILPISSRSAAAVENAQRALAVARMKRLPRFSSAIRAFRAANLASAKRESLPSLG